jgi:hypothetical protein
VYIWSISIFGHILRSFDSTEFIGFLDRFYNITGLTLTAGLAGDFNSDGAVNAADYVYWRKNFGDDPAKYYAWRANFGASLSPGSGTGLLPANLRSSSVPEPSATVLILSGTFFTAARRIVRTQKRERTA